MTNSDLRKYTPVLFQGLLCVTLVALFYIFFVSTDDQPQSSLILGEATSLSNVEGKANVENTSHSIYFHSDTYNSNVQITSPDSENDNLRKLSGYAWSEDLGWIEFGDDNINPAVEVTYDTGILTGKADVLNTGNVIDFNAIPYNSEVIINVETGEFSGYAWSEGVGWIDFTNTGVYVTDTAAPTNPSSILGYDTIEKSNSFLPSEWKVYDSPYFEWTGAIDIGDGTGYSSGIAGYWVYWGTDSTAIPSTAGSQHTEANFTSSSLTNVNTYYLRIQTYDNNGNISSEVWEAFIYKFDNEVPDNPSGVSVTPAGWSQTNSFEFYWPAGADADSQLWGYCYKTGTPEVEEICIEDNSVFGIEAYQSGENIFYLRSLDNAGNKNPNFIQTTYYYNADAPSAPTNLNVEPETNDDNAFTFTWEAPTDFNGEIKGYHYSINTEPTIDNSTFTTETQVGPGPYATRQGENKFYVLTEDTAGNKNFEIYSEVSFYANTTAPGIPLNLTATDSSDRETNIFAITLNWKASVDVSPEHYNVYRSTDGQNFESIAATTSEGYLDLGLQTTNTYYYYITAEDNAGAESGHSAEVSKKPTGKFTTAPVITVDPKAKAGRTSTVITWETDRESNSFVQIGTSTIYSRTQGQWEPTKEHRVDLKGLNSSTGYHFRVQSIDDPKLIDYDSNTAFSEDYTFTTGEIPKINDLQVKEIRHTSAIITWTTDVTSTSVVYLSGGEDRTIEDQASGGTTQHAILIENLHPGTTYTVRVSGTDDEENVLIGENHTFITPSYPQISDVRLEQQKEEAVGTVLVSWSTNVPTTSIVKYNKKEVAGTIENSTSELVTEHEMLASGLEDNSEYRIVVQGRDSYGNLALSEVNTFLTNVDTRPPKISEVKIETGLIGNGSNAKAQIVVSWRTDEISTSQVEFDTGIGATEGLITFTQKTKKDETLTDSHIVVISELQPSQVYRLRIVSKDQSGNSTLSESNIVVTDEAIENALELVINSLMETFGWLFGE